MGMRVRVPATSGNLGCGFDCLGMALEVWLEARALEAPRRRLWWRGEGQGSLDLGPANLLWRGFDALCAHAGRTPPAVEVRVVSRIPVARGLGSSAAAVVAGMVLARRLTGARVPVDDLMAIGTRTEGHPDNVVPALVGGVTVAVGGPGRVAWGRVPLGLDWRVLLLVPRRGLETKTARAVLPRRVTMTDAVHNVGRACLLVAALASGRDDLVGPALEDRLHQPYRARLVPGLEDLDSDARAVGAMGGYLSGAGPTLAVLARRADRRLVERLAPRVGRGARVLWTRIARRGALGRAVSSTLSR